MRGVVRKYSILLLLAFVGCKDESSRLSPKVNSFLIELLTIMERNSINRNAIDWPTLRNNVIARAGNSQTIQAAEPALLLALEGLGDNHSFILTSYQKTLYSGSANCTGGATTVVPTSDVGYVLVPPFSGTASEADLLARNLQSSIRNQDHVNVKGWIVDLRGNTGGNMWPMLAGIGPVLGDGLAGHFIDANNIPQPFGYFNGSSLLNQTAVISVPNAYALLKSNSKVAVLVDNGTASSGEAIAIAFVGRANTRFFGAPTCGLSTGNQGFSLSDGSTLILSVSIMADRNKNKFGGRINPDEAQTGVGSVTAAIDWITK